MSRELLKNLERTTLKLVLLSDWARYIQTPEAHSMKATPPPDFAESPKRGLHCDPLGPSKGEVFEATAAGENTERHKGVQILELTKNVGIT